MCVFCGNDVPKAQHDKIVSNLIAEVSQESSMKQRAEVERDSYANSYLKVSNESLIKDKLIEDEERKVRKLELIIYGEHDGDKVNIYSILEDFLFKMPITLHELDELKEAVEKHAGEHRAFSILGRPMINYHQYNNKNEVNVKISFNPDRVGSHDIESFLSLMTTESDCYFEGGLLTIPGVCSTYCGAEMVVFNYLYNKLENDEWFTRASRLDETLDKLAYISALRKEINERNRISSNND